MSPSKTMAARRQMRTPGERTSGAWTGGCAIHPDGGDETALQATAIRLPHTILREQTADRFFFNPMENLSQTAGPSQA